MWLVTWNVLHRIHAENWREAVPDRFPVEADRIARISRRIAALFRDHEAGDLVVCLQEVSGDQLRSLETHHAGLHVLRFCFPRVPSLHGGGPCPLLAPEEYLVTIAARGTLTAAAAYPSDPGKGYLAVDLGGGLTVVNTHVSGGERRSHQLAALAGVAAGDVVICGDFNTSAHDVMAGLANHFGDSGTLDTAPSAFAAAVFAADALPTRPRADAGSGKPPAIDHIVGRGRAPGAAVVVDVDGESDHNLVRARVG